MIRVEANADFFCGKGAGAAAAVKDKNQIRKSVL